MTVSALNNPTTLDEAVLRAHRQPLPALHASAVAQTTLWPTRTEGTGGTAVRTLIQQQWGYRPFDVALKPTTAAQTPVSVEWMQRVKAGFGRTMSRLPQVFGVSRQTLYNWLNGETPSTVHQARLRELAAAADVFRECGITPTSAMLGRSVTDGKNFLELLASGAEGKDTAQRLVRIVRRGESSRAKLESLLAGHEPDSSAADLSAPALDESA